MAIRAFAVAAALGLEFAVVAITQQGIVIGICFHIHTAAVAAIATRWAAAWNVLFPAKREAAIAAVAAFHQDFGFVNKHWMLFLKVYTKEVRTGNQKPVKLLVAGPQEKTSRTTEQFRRNADLFGASQTEAGTSCQPEQKRQAVLRVAPHHFLGNIDESNAMPGYFPVIFQPGLAGIQEFGSSGRPVSWEYALDWSEIAHYMERFDPGIGIVGIGDVVVHSGKNQIAHHNGAL